MPAYAARKGLVYISSTGTGAAALVLNLNSWSLDQATDKIEITSFGDANKTYVQGLPDVKGSFSGFWNDLETKLNLAAASVDGCKIYLYPSSDAPTKYKYGTAWLDLSINCEVSGAVSISCNFVAAGSWGGTV